jgi:eukaryotic-like serine/threonine-protein kinase
MGVVWQARDELLKRDVAVKELVWPPHFTEAEQEMACRRAVREAQMAGRLAHLNVVRIYDILQEDGHPWIIMELLPYQSLRDLVRADGPLAPARAARVGLGVLAALGAAHAEGVLHRDVKPANILVGPDGRVVLTDFGIARAVDSPTLTAAGALVGSPSYIAPERARGGLSSPAGDLWGLGASLYAAVEGHPPFERDAPLATLTAVVLDEPEEAVHAGLLWPVISGLLRKDPDERFDAAETERALREVSDHDEPAHVVSASRRIRPAFWRVRPASSRVPPVPQSAVDTESAAGGLAGAVPLTRAPRDEKSAHEPTAAEEAAAAKPLAAKSAGAASAAKPNAADDAAMVSSPLEEAPESAVVESAAAVSASIAVAPATPGAAVVTSEPDMTARAEPVAVSARATVQVPVAASAPVSSADQPPSAASPVAKPDSRRPRRSRRPAIALAALIVVAAGATALALALTSSPGHTAASSGTSSRSAIPPARSSGAPTPGASITPSAAAHGATASANPSASPASARAGGQVSPSSSSGSPGSGGVGYGALPADYYRFTNSTGFSIGVPDGWRIQHVGHYVYIIDRSNAGIFLLIDQSDSPKPNPLLDWEQQAANRASTYPDYHLIRLESVYYPQAEKAADWEFTYVKDGILVHILNRNVLANAHHAYALYWSTAESDWNAYYHYFQGFADTFRPAK